MFSIGELSKRSGVKVPTIRYYEKIDLLDSPDRSEGNQRRYSQDGLQRLSFIRHARELGFHLEDIRELIGLSQDASKSCHMANDIVARHLEETRSRIARLQRLEKELERMAACHGDCIAECAVIESLADHSHCLSEHD